MYARVIMSKTRYFRERGGFSGSNSHIRCLGARESDYTCFYYNDSPTNANYWTINRCLRETGWEEFFPLDLIRKELGAVDNKIKV